ncbi:hypothetical protein ES705_15978 [subsurface metagenome]
MGKENEQKSQEQEEQSPDLESLLKELPEKYQPVIRHLVTGVFNSLVQTNERIAELEKKPAVQDAPGTLDGLTPEQKYNVLMSRASAPAAQAQMQLYQGLLAGMKGNSGGGELAALAKSAESIQALRTILLPEASPIQQAMERAQVSQIISQTRLMNKVAGKETSDYLDKLEKSLAAGEGEE